MEPQASDRSRENGSGQGRPSGPAVGIASRVCAGAGSRSGRPVVGSGRDAGARVGADPARADVGLAVHLLPRRRAADGRRPRHDADSGLRVQLCGDAHLSNFGVFASPERRLVFDVNDFDETLPGPLEWDVKRLAASLAVAGRDNGFTTARSISTVVSRAVGRYRKAMREFAEHADARRLVRAPRPRRPAPPVAAQLPERGSKTPTKGMAKAAHPRQHAGLEQADHGWWTASRIVSDPPLIVPDRGLRPASSPTRCWSELGELLRTYRRSLQSDRRHLLEQFQLVHLARKVVGVGSVGTRAWIAAAGGRTTASRCSCRSRRPRRRCWRASCGRSEYDNQGERVVAGQQLMQASSDIFLGWERASWQRRRPRTSTCASCATGRSRSASSR